MENWKVIEQFPNYECSDLGNFRRCKAGKGTVAGKLRRTYKNPVTGYHSVTLGNPQRPELARTQSAHKVLAATWLPNPDNHPHVGFKDANRDNLAITNLFWHAPFECSINYSIIVEKIGTPIVHIGLSLAKASEITLIHATKIRHAIETGQELIIEGWKISGKKLR